jgi:two-component system LytT family sensor kinase
MKRLIILLLLLSCFRFSYAEELTAAESLDLMKQMESRFLERDAPLKYDSNILILLKGNPSKKDSLIFNELVDTLNVLIDKWDVYLIPKGTSNLVVEINSSAKESACRFIEQFYSQVEISKTTVVLDLPETLDYASRKKAIYYHILRSLVVSKSGIPLLPFAVPGSVFTESDPARILFLPIDFDLIKVIYSNQLQEFLQMNKKGYSPSPKIQLLVFVNLIAILISLVFLILLFQKGKFSAHNYNFSRFLSQGLLVLSAFMIYILVYDLYFYIAFSPSGYDFKLIIYSILGVCILGIVSIIVIFLIEYFTLKGKDNLPIQIIVPILSTSFVPLILLLFVQLMFPTISQDSLFISVSIRGSITYFTLFGIARAFYIFTSKKSESIIRKKDLELARMNELHKQAELQSLRAKINPHFLYNALNSIASLATTDARKTEQMALALSDFFKYAINREQKQLNTLSEELNAIRTYLEIEKVRFGDRLSFEIDCPEDLLNIQIPQLLIQPLVENAIKHGLSQITENGLIRILVSQAENQLKIRVYDNGPAFPDGPLTGFGIQNTQERIALLYGAKATINWQNGEEKYVEISIPV